MNVAHWVEENIYFNKEEYFSALVASIAQAHKSIELETYIFDDSIVAQRVVEALIDASLRGVAVRVSIDGVGSFFSISKILGHFKNSTVEVKIFHSFRLFNYTHLNNRLHRKICLIDGISAYVGSFNISEHENRDTAVKVSGTSVLFLLNAFNKTWFKRIQFEKTSIPSIVRLNNTARLRRASNLDLKRRIENAQEKICVTNAYFVPPLFMLKALCTASQNGVETTLLVSERSDHFFMKWLSETYYQTLLINGARIFEYKEKFLHAKTIIIDQWCVVGTSNFNHRSVFHDLEVDLVLSKPNSLTSLAQQFEIDISKSHEITLANIKKTHFLARVIIQFLKLFKHWT